MVKSLFTVVKIFTRNDYPATLDLKKKSYLTLSIVGYKYV